MDAQIYKEWNNDEGKSKWTVEFLPTTHVAGTVTSDYKFSGFKNKKACKKFIELLDADPNLTPYNAFQIANR
jgi:hypothetical protein